MNSQLLIILIFVSFTFLSWLFGELRKKAEQRRIEKERERRREEALRTGRDLPDFATGAPGPPPTAPSGRQQPDLKTLAERRQAQLRELREQQASRTRNQRAPRPTVIGAPIGAPTASPPTAAPAPFGRPRPGQPPRAPQRPAPPGPARTPPLSRGAPGRQTARPLGRPDARAQHQLRQQEAARLQLEARRREAEARRRREAAETRAPSVTAPSLLGVIPPSPGDRARRTPPTGQLLTAADWRRAIVVSELLAPPIALRDESSTQRAPF